jgi:hypothetical protein
MVVEKLSCCFISIWRRRSSRKMGGNKIIVEDHTTGNIDRDIEIAMGIFRNIFQLTLTFVGKHTGGLRALFLSFMMINESALQFAKMVEMDGEEMDMLRDIARKMVQKNYQAMRDTGEDKIIKNLYIKNKGE